MPQITNKVYQFTNKLDYTTKIYVWEITDKSVYYIYADKDNQPISKNRFRMSLKSFNELYNKKYKISISEIRIGEEYEFLPTGEISIFLNEDQINWFTINPNNYIGYTYNLDGREEK